MEAAEQLGASALCRAVTQAGITRGEIGALFFVSSPSIDARLINKLKLSPSTRRIPIFGLGCVAGIACAADYVKAYPSQVAALVAVEICSLTLQREDLTVANLISSGLFGDGAAAVLVAGDDFEQPGPKIIDTRSTLYPDTEDVMGWKISENGFEVVLSRNTVSRDSISARGCCIPAGRRCLRPHRKLWVSIARRSKPHGNACALWAIFHPRWCCACWNVS